MKEAYPNLVERLDLTRSVLEREEAAFDRTLRAGPGSARGGARTRPRPRGRPTLDGELAFRLHDTHGFPIELTEELAAEAGLGVDRDGVRRGDGRAARAGPRGRPGAGGGRRGGLPRPPRAPSGETAFVGRSPTPTRSRPGSSACWPAQKQGTAEIFLDRSPFYAEGGGQVGDTGTIVTETGRAEVFDTVGAAAGPRTRTGPG